MPGFKVAGRSKNFAWKGEEVVGLNPMAQHILESPCLLEDAYERVSDLIEERIHSEADPLSFGDIKDLPEVAMLNELEKEALRFILLL